MTSTAAIFGGSFDPVHNGHLAVIKAVIDTQKPDNLIVFPSKISPLKTQVFAPESDRIKMLNLAIESLPASKTKVSIDLFELSAPSPSYTIHTLNYLQTKFKTTQFSLVIGYDNYQVFHRWKEYEQILSQVYLIVINRPGFSEENLQIPQKYKSKIKFITIKESPISSSKIRKSIAEKKSIINEVPDPINNYINRYKIYE